MSFQSHAYSKRTLSVCSVTYIEPRYSTSLFDTAELVYHKQNSKVVQYGEAVKARSSNLQVWEFCCLEDEEGFSRVGPMQQHVYKLFLKNNGYLLAVKKK
jgi:hypothetical protein